MNWKIIPLVALLVTSVVGVARAAEEADEDRQVTTTTGKRSQVRRNDIPITGYTRVRGNPRRATPVANWNDAISYMQSQAFQNDVRVRLPEGLPPSFRPFYSSQIVPFFNDTVRLAAKHNYPGTCGTCEGSCREQKFLKEYFRRVKIEPGSVYLAVTEGRQGAVRVNRLFRDRRYEFFAYRVYVKVVIKRFANVQEGREAAVWASTYIDLIVKCGNAGLGELEVWEVDRVEFAPPVVEIPETPVIQPSRSRAKAYASAEASAEATATANAEGGTAIVNNYAPPRELGYRRPDRPTQETSVYRAGGIQGAAVPRMSQRQFQQQQQAQWQQQFMEFWQQIINQNMNNVSVAVAAG